MVVCIFFLQQQYSYGHDRGNDICNYTKDGLTDNYTKKDLWLHLILLSLFVFFGNKAFNDITLKKQDYPEDKNPCKGPKKR